MYIVLIIYIGKKKTISKRYFNFVNYYYYYCYYYILLILYERIVYKSSNTIVVVVVVVDIYHTCQNPETF